MATKKNAQEPAGEKQANHNGGKKKQAGKKAVTRRDGPGTLEVRPPIIIGGGGSTLIWIEEGFELVDIPSKPSKYILDSSKYKCKKLRVKATGKDVGILNVYTCNGQDPYELPKPVKNPKEHNTQFTDY